MPDASSPFASLAAPPRPRTNAAASRPRSSVDTATAPTPARPAPAQNAATTPAAAPAQTAATSPFARLANGSSASATGATARPRAVEALRALRDGGAGAGPRTVSVPRRNVLDSLSEEQRSLVESRASVIIGNAFAGGGKTTTGLAYCQHHASESITYLTFNNANQKDIQAKLRARRVSNATAMTTHAIARRSLIRDGRLGDARNGEDPVVKTWNPHTVKDMLIAMRQLGPQGSYRLAALTQKTLDEFFKTAAEDREPGMRHIEAIRDEWGVKSPEDGYVLDLAKKLWREMAKPDRKVQIPHDGYLKLWAMDRPQINADTIILDEFQDTRPCVLDVLLNQRGARLVALGDEHQSIYHFTGAINAGEALLAQAGAERFALTKTWRFGSNVADICNLLLGDLKGEEHAIRGMGPTASSENQYLMLLSRTNASLYAEAFNRRGVGVYWNGGIKRYPLTDAVDAWFIKQRRNSEVKNTFLRRFQSWDELSDYSDAAKDVEVRQLIKLVEDYGDDIPQFVEAIYQNDALICSGQQEIDIGLSTAFIAKGGEWDEIRVADDFEFLGDVEETLGLGRPLSLEQIQEINLGYVAVSRAKKLVHLNKETADWIANIETHRQARHQASRIGAPSQRIRA